MAHTVPSPRHPSVWCVGVSREGGPARNTRHARNTRMGVRRSGRGRGRGGRTRGRRRGRRRGWRGPRGRRRDGVGGGQLGGGLVVAPEAGQRPGAGLVGVGEVEVGEAGVARQRHRPVGVVQGEIAVAEHGVGVRHEPGGPRRVLRARPGRPAPVVRRGVGPAEQVVDLVVRAVRPARAAPTSRCWRRRRGGGAARPRHRPRRRPAGGRRSAGSPSSGAPVSSNDFIESRIHGHPSPTLADVPGLSARSRWIVVTLVTPSAPGVMIHSTVLGGSSASAASYSTRHVITSRRPGLDLVTSPATASVPSGST